MEIINNFNSILNSFKIDANCISFSDLKGAFYFDLKLNHGTTLNKILKFSTEIALALKAPSKPRFQPLLEQGIIRCEFLKKKTNKISLFGLGSSIKRPIGNLSCLLGEKLNGDPFWIDFVNFPHLLIAGTTNSGKSTALHTLIANFLLYPNINLYLSDTKSIEFSSYSNFKNINVSFSYQETLDVLKDLYEQMEKRYLLIKKDKSAFYNLNYIVLIIDELADLKFQDKNNILHKFLCSLAQKGRAAKIHIIAATQRPSVSIINGDIKANFPARLSFKVASQVDSRVILDSSGAELLTGYGDAIINSTDSNMIRFKAAYTNPQEIIELLHE